MITQSFYVAEFYYSEKGKEKASDIDIRRRMESTPPHSSYQGLIYFYQTHSHNRHLKLTRIELTIERSYQTHSHSKLARLARRYLLRRRNMSLSKIHCCYIIISTEKYTEKLKEKHTLEQSELFCCVITSSRLKESLKDCCYNNSEFKKKKVLCD